MVYKVVLGLVAMLAMAAGPALADTRVLSAKAKRVEGGPAFRVVTGIPKGLKRQGVTTVGDGALAQDTIYLFPEAQGVTLDATTRPGSGPAIAAGTRVDSVYICVDTTELPTDPGPRNGAAYAAAVRFDNPDLLGIALRPTQLAATAKAVGKPGVVYANSRFTGVDPFWIGQDGQNFTGGVFTFYGDANGIDCRRLIFRAKD